MRESKSTRYKRALAGNMKHGPVVLDILVDHAPAYKTLKIDTQLNKSVEQLLSEK